MILAAPTPAAPPRAFDGRLPSPTASGLYRYADHFDAPFVGNRSTKGRLSADRFESTDAMARWVAGNPEARPFFRHPDFVAEFGRISKREAIAVADELWARADRAAHAAGTKITLPARLGGSSNERK